MMEVRDPIKTAGYADLLKTIKERITEAQYAALKSVNKELIGLYWYIGRMIAERQKGDIWGRSVVGQLAKDLRAEFPGTKGLSSRNIRSCNRFCRERVCMRPGHVLQAQGKGGLAGQW
jgi:hypothetical protein